MVEQGIENPRVVGSIPTGGICGFSSFGRARPCQGRGGGFEPRNPLADCMTGTACAVFCFPIAVPSPDRLTGIDFSAIYVALCPGISFRHPIVATYVAYGPVAQLVRALACHARGHGFEPRLGRDLW